MVSSSSAKVPCAKPGGIQMTRWFSSLSSTATWSPRRGEPCRTSTTTSTMAPRRQRRYLPIGGSHWKCSPRMTPRCETVWMACSKDDGIPCASSSPFIHERTRYPRWSGKLCAVTTFRPGICSGSIRIAPSESAMLLDRAAWSQAARTPQRTERRRHDLEAHRRCVLTTVAIVGSTGQLGSDLVEVFATERVHGLAHEDMDIGDATSVRRVLGALSPDIVVNTAAFHNVPRCETQVEQAYALNAVAPRRLARLCDELGARLVHVSTDYVFDGTKQTPYVETDRPAPLNVYGVSKLAGEYEGLSAGGAHQVVRSSGLYGLRPCRAKGGNFIDTMYRVASEKP